MIEYLNELDEVNELLEGGDDLPLGGAICELTDIHDEVRTLAFSALRDDDPMARASGREAAIQLAALAVRVAALLS